MHLSLKRKEFPEQLISSHQMMRTSCNFCYDAGKMFKHGNNVKRMKKGKLMVVYLQLMHFYSFEKNVKRNPCEDKSSKAISILTTTVFDIARICQELKLAALRIQIFFLNRCSVSTLKKKYFNAAFSSFLFSTLRNLNIKKNFKNTAHIPISVCD